jgi:S-adenosylmethionine:tRNA ribosyltransferase-isomerase
VKTSDFDFELPDELIAQEPPAIRGDSRLLVLDRAASDVRDSVFADLAEHLHPGDLLVLNDTRVFPARLIGRRVPTGGAVECFLVRQVPAVQDLDGGSAEWEALVHPGQKLKPGARILFERDGLQLHGEILGRHFFGRRTVRLWTDGGDVAETIERLGHMPLPPYIKRDDRDSDRERYQTVFARTKGSIAAPTAGLHFTTELFDRLAARGVERVDITLHVGYGTFKPVRVDVVEEHVVDPETFTVGEAAAAALNRARAAGRRVIAVGTTTTRALESLPLDASGQIVPATGETQLFVRPGHEFRIVQGLITNFHLPQSSLLMLVAAFAGRERVLAAYAHAVAAGYRFYSYGDAMLIL